MKNSLKYLLLVVLPLGAVCLTSCVSPVVKNAYKIVQKPKIYLHVVGSPKELKITTPGDSRCGVGKHGCVYAAQGETAVLSFNFQGSPDWKFTEMTICPGVSKPTGQCNLDPSEQREFAATDKTGVPKYRPDEHGVIKLPLGANALTEFYLIDHNNFEQDYFYTIQACHDSFGCLVSDPPIVNKGNN